MSKIVNSQPSDLKSHIGYHLRSISNVVSQTFARKLTASGVTPAEWVILREMYSTDEKTSPSTIAEFTGLTRGAVSKLIDRLLKKKLVSRTEATDDRRYQEIKLTLSAVKLVPKLARIADENDEFFFSSLTPSEKKSLKEILMKLATVHTLKTNPIE